MGTKKLIEEREKTLEEIKKLLKKDIILFRKAPNSLRTVKSCQGEASHVTE